MHKVKEMPSSKEFSVHADSMKSRAKYACSTRVMQSEDTRKFGGKAFLLKIFKFKENTDTTEPTLLISVLKMITKRRNFL